MKVPARWLPGFILAICLLFIAPDAFADDLQRTVVLKVKSGGTEHLVAAMEEVPGIEVKDQTWFLKQVKSRGMKAKKLLKRPADLRHVMSGSDIVYVVYVSDEDGQLSGRIFGPDGEVIDEVELEATTLDEEGAGVVRKMMEGVLGIEPEPDTPLLPAEPEPATTNADVSASDVDGSPAKSGEPGGLSVRAGGRVFKRDQTFAGGNNAVLSFESGLYPGFSLLAQMALKSVEVGESVLVLFLGVDGGFDSLQTTDEKFSILHLDGLLGVGLRFETLDVRLGARHVRYSLASNDVFPSLVHTLAVLGLGTEQALGALILSADVEVHPWGLYGSKSAELFGTKSSVLGFGGRLGVGYAVSGAIAVQGAYGFRVGRAKFPGAGGLDFADTRGFELVHGPELTITWRP